MMVPGSAEEEEYIRYLMEKYKHKKRKQSDAAPK